MSKVQLLRPLRALSTDFKPLPRGNLTNGEEEQRCYPPEPLRLFF